MTYPYVEHGDLPDPIAPQRELGRRPPERLRRQLIPCIHMSFSGMHHQLVSHGSLGTAGGAATVYSSRHL